MVSLFLAKVVGAVWITLVSALGTLAPFTFLASNGRDSSAQRSCCGRCVSHARTNLGSSNHTLSLANCFSAGMLLTTALVHFFPQSFTYDPSTSPAVLSTLMLVGIVTPATLERCLDGQAHGHSHGSTSDHYHNHSSSRSSSKGGREPPRQGMSTATILVMLMCFHGMMEGMLLGFEEHAQSLVSASLPLSVHRFFDGLVIGVSLAKERQRNYQDGYIEMISEGDAQLTSTSVSTESAAVLVPAAAPAPVERSQSTWKLLHAAFTREVILWLALTPLTMLFVIIILGGSEGNTSAGTGSTLATQAEYKDPQHMREGPRSQLLAAVEAVGSGSFVYVSHSLLLHEELRGVRAAVAFVLGVLATFALFAITEHMEV